MPYSSNADLPESVRSRYSSHCQDVWRNVWNSVHERTGDESRAFASANSKAQQCEGKAMTDLYTQSIPSSDFKIFAPLLKTSRSTDGKMRLHGVASSSIKDRHGDTINASALAEMERSANENMTIFLNHEYRVPEDVAGSVERATMRQSMTDPDIHDLAFDILINESNERAVKAWEAIQGGTKLGLSIGAKIPEGGAKRDRATGTYQIDHLDLMETSLVGVPANPRSWVEYAVKSLNATISISDDEVIKETTVADEPEPEDEPEADETTEEDRPPEAGKSAEGLDEMVGGGQIPQHEPQPDPNKAIGIVNGSATYTIGEDGPELLVPTNSTTDITDATVNIKTPFADVTVDTGNRGGKPAASDGSSQEAPPSDPESEDADETAASPWAGLLPVKSDELIETDIETALKVLEPTVVASLRTSNELLKALTRELSDTKDELRRKDDEYRALEAATTKVVSETAQILDALSNTPVGRRAVVREVSDKFASLKSVYAEEFLTLLKRS